MVVGEDVALAADNHARAEAGGALLLLHLVAEKLPEQRVIGKRVAPCLYRLGGENIHYCGHRHAHGVVIRGQASGRALPGGGFGGVRFFQTYHLRAGRNLPAKPFGTQRGNHKQRGEADGCGLTEYEPNFAHDG